MSNDRFALPARNSIPVNEPGSAAYRRLRKKLKGKGGSEQPRQGWNRGVARPVRGKQR